ncbi:aldo/keto reductase [Variovorax sp. 22077]|uniref:aldo/keto reductase n=1 Tax=Variovorax sp. 22077 TaxID=3453867 RepID=UPI003F87D67D
MPLKNTSFSENRRQLLQHGIGVAAALPLAWAAKSSGAQTGTSAPRSSAPPAGVLTRTIPRTGESVSALGLGTFLTFDTLPGQPRSNLREVVKTYWEGGVRVLDTSPLYGSAENTVGDFVTALDINDQLFIANKLWTTGEYLTDESHALRSLEQSQLRLWRQRFDLMQCHSLVNADAVVPLLNAWKKEGHTRLVGVTHHESGHQDLLAQWIDRGAVDFVQVNYSIFNRHAEKRVFPPAQAHGVGVLVNMAMEKGRLHKVVEGHPLPAFAREYGIENWAQYFLKFVMSHPAVTCCLSSTANPDHAAENVGALRGPLPDAATRANMLRYLEHLPGFNQIASMPWYPGKDKHYPGFIRRGQASLRLRNAL